MLSNSGFNFEKKIQIVIVNNSANINKTNNISQNTKTTPYDIRIQILAWDRNKYVQGRVVITISQFSSLDSWISNGIYKQPIKKNLHIFASTQNNTYYHDIKNMDSTIAQQSSNAQLLFKHWCYVLILLSSLMRNLLISYLLIIIVVKSQDIYKE